MSRLFDGTDDSIIWSPGSCTVSGAFTMAAVIKIAASNGAWQAYLSAETSGGSALYGFGRTNGNEIHLSKDGGGGGQANAITHTSADGWLLVAVTKATGTVVPRFHKYPIGGSPTHTDAVGGATVTNQAGSFGRYKFGEIGGSDDFNGRLWAAAHWNSSLSDGNIESLVTTFTQAGWLSLSPAGMWDDTDSFATDLTGNGANRTALNGTTDDADDPAGASTWVGAPISDAAEKLRTVRSNLRFA